MYWQCERHAHPLNSLRDSLAMIGAVEPCSAPYANSSRQENTTEKAIAQTDQSNESKFAGNWKLTRQGYTDCIFGEENRHHQGQWKPAARNEKCFGLSHESCALRSSVFYPKAHSHSDARHPASKPGDSSAKGGKYTVERQHDHGNRKYRNPDTADGSIPALDVA